MNNVLKGVISIIILFIGSYLCYQFIYFGIDLVFYSHAAFNALEGTIMISLIIMAIIGISIGRWSKTIKYVSR